MQVTGIGENNAVKQIIYTIRIVACNILWFCLRQFTYIRNLKRKSNDNVSPVVCLSISSTRQPTWLQVFYATICYRLCLVYPGLIPVVVLAIIFQSLPSVARFVVAVQDRARCVVLHRPRNLPLLSKRRKQRKTVEYYLKYSSGNYN